MFNKMFNKIRHKPGMQKTDWLYITIGLILFAVITFWTITKSSIWFDEAFGAYLIHFNFIEIARYTATDVHPPLYYWLLKLWSMLFGNTELGLRSMSVLFGGISIIFGYLLTHRLFGKKAARISLIFMVLSPMLVRYSQEARMYTLVAAIALAATYVLTFAINTKKRLPWIVYGVLVGLGMWVHYFSAIVWIAHWIWRGDVIRRVARKGKFIKTFFSKEWIMAHVVAVGSFLPWMPFFASQMFTVQAFGFWIPPVTPNTMTNFMTNVVYYQDAGNVTGWLVLGFLAVVVLLALLAFRVYRSQNEAERQAYRLIITLAFVPMLILFILSMPPLRSVFIDRYLITSALGIALFIGVTLAFGLKFLNPKWQVLITVFTAGLMVIGITNVWYYGNYNKNSHNSSGARQIVEAAVAKSADNQPIIAATPWMFYEATFYSTSSHPIYYIVPKSYPYGSLDMLKYNDQHKIKDVAMFTKQNSIVWYIGFIGGGGKLNPPNSNWEPIKDVSINDPINGTPEYEAIQYKISNN
jgi:4-amino-4-deoxy-L-arabinose transferase-like glycosyltransferase